MTLTKSYYHIAYILVIITLCIYGYHGFMSHPWSYDDLDHIKHAQIAQSDISHIISPTVKEPSRVVLNTYFFLAHEIFGTTPKAFHAMKIAFHTLNILLLTFVFLSLFKDTKLSVLSGLIFAIHGTHYEAIYHIAGTGYLLCTLFLLIALYSTHRACSSANKNFFVLAVGTYAAATFSYEGALVAIVPLLYIWWTSSKRQFGYPIGLLSVVGLFWFVEKYAFGFINTKADFYELGIGWHIPHTFLLFIGRIFINCHFTPFGWTSLPPKDIPRDDIYLYVIAGAIIYAMLLYQSQKHNIIRILTLWITITILPTTLGTNDYYYTRYFYLPAIGASGLTAIFYLWIYRQIPETVKLKRPIAGIALVLLIASSLYKIYIFEGYFLFNTANYYASPNYANDPQTAITHYERAQTEYGIQDPLLSLNLASCYEQTNNHALAFNHYQQAIRLNPNDARPYHAQARLFLLSGQIDEAITSAQKAAQCSPVFIQEYHKLGTVLYQKHYVEEALRVFQNAIIIAPEYPQNDLIYFNLGALYQNRNQFQDAIQAYQKAQDLKTDIIEVYQNLGVLYLQNQNWNKAITVLTEATKRQPKDAQSWQNLAYAYAQVGQSQAAHQASQNAKRALNTP